MIRSRFILISFLILLLFNYPLLASANKHIYILGLPLLYVYIMGVWIMAIVLLFLTVKKRLTTKKDTHE